MKESLLKCKMQLKFLFKSLCTDKEFDLVFSLQFEDWSKPFAVFSPAQTNLSKCSSVSPKGHSHST